MLYTVTNDFIKINESSGTIQNNSQIYDVEISHKQEVGSGILLRALNKFTFTNQTLFARCTSKNGFATVNVVPFIVDSGAITVNGGSSAVVDNPDSFNDDDLNDIFKP